MSNKLLGVLKHANQHRLSRLTMEVHTDELRIIASAVESYTDELISALEAAEKRIADMQEQLARYSMSPGEADQRRCESRAVRDVLGFGKDADNVAPVDLLEQISALRLRIAELQTVSTAAEKLVRCKGRYHSEKNYRSLAALFGVKTPDLPALDTEARLLSVSGNRIKRRESEFWISLEYIANKLLESGIKLEVGE